MTEFVCDHCGEAFCGTDRVYVLDSDWEFVISNPWRLGKDADWVHASCFDEWRSEDQGPGGDPEDQGPGARGRP